MLKQFFLLFALLFFLIGCSTACHKNMAAINVLVKQEALLSSLKASRAQIQSLLENPTLKANERALASGIDELIRSNRALKQALRKIEPPSS